MMQLSKMIAVILLLLSFVPLASAKITAQQVAIVINTEDADSQLIADYYQKKRGIPQQNIIKISMPAGKNSIGEGKFAEVYEQVKNLIRKSS